MANIDTLYDLRLLGTRGIVFAGWMASLGMGVGAAMMGGPFAYAFIISILVNIIPTYFAITKLVGPRAASTVAIMVFVHPALFTYAMQLSPWQIDMHMYFFVGLAMLTVYCSVRPIIIASVLIAGHHLVLSLTVSSWVFPDGGSFERTLIHAFAVVLQAGALSFIARSLARLFHAQEASRKAGEALLLEADEARAEAEQARAAAEAALQEAESERETRARMVAARKEEVGRLTQKFEQSVSNVAHSVAEAAAALNGAAEDLDQVANATGNRANEVAEAAKRSKNSTHNVASNITSLTRAMTEVAATAAQQSAIARQAEHNSQNGDRTVSSLAEHSLTIGGSADTISAIADRTTILALNATIEAALAGDAGRGFAVVATEVRDLAAETGQATSRILELLSEMRDGTNEAERDFGGIADSIGALIESVTVIQSAVDEQQVATADIEYSAREAATGVDAMAQSIDDVSSSAEKTGKLSGEVRRSVAMLIEQVTTLENATKGFVEILDAA